MSIEGSIAEASAVKTPAIDNRQAPAALQVIGYGALVPLVAMAMVIFFTWGTPGAESALRAEVGYGAALLSFIGGIRWGLAVATGGDYLLFRPLGLATLAMPFAWVVFFMDPRIALAALMAGFQLLLLAERVGLPSPMPGWYRALQLPFTIFVELALGVSLAAVLLG
ncbi:MAG TPA: DUF3429 domain-containing protein [Parvibaculum sp.]|jgi:hypothetical protein